MATADFLCRNHYPTNKTSTWPLNVSRLSRFMIFTFALRAEEIAGINFSLEAGLFSRRLSLLSPSLLLSLNEHFAIREAQRKEYI
jgi:hypothetical protein